MSENNFELKPFNLQTEQLTNPIGIGTAIPRFSWMLQSGIRGNKQTAYRIRVASTKEKLQANSPDIWDSGEVQDGESCLVPFGGAPLKSQTLCWWDVQVTDAAGNQGPVSDPAFFETGLLSQDDWKGTWLTAADYVKNRALYFRCDFTVKKPLKRARAYICGLGYNELSINGSKMGDSILNPGWTTFHKHSEYVTHDITPNLNQGLNTVGVILGEGWYNNDHEVFRFYSFLKPLDWLGQPRFIAQIYLEYEDGTSDLVVTDKNSGWTSGTGPIYFNSVFDGERYDARLEKPGWDCPGFTEKWEPAIQIESPGCELVAQMNEPIKVIRDLPAVSVKEVKPGVFVYDMGQNFAGLVELKVSAPRGTEVHLRFAENLYEDGTINQENLRLAQNHDIYITKGEGVETYLPRFTYHGFRYCQLEGIENATLDTIMGKVVRSAVPITGEFTCSNDLLNRIQKAVMWTEESNLHSVPTDCPQRDERQGWLNDVTVRVEETIYNFGMGAFYRKWHQDITDEQAENGCITDVAPRAFGSLQADPLCSIFLLVPWYTYHFFGDIKLIKDRYENMKRWQQFLTNNSKDGIVQYSNYGDWAGPAAGCDQTHDFSALSVITPGIFVSTIFYYFNATLLAKMANYLGKTEEEWEHLKQAEYIKASINREWLNKETANYALGSQASNLLALHFDIVPQEYRDRVLANLVKDIEKNNYHLTTGNIATKYMFEVLSDNGLEDVAYKIATREDYPSWGYMLNKGATTIWERWEYAVASTMNSHNHPMYGTVSTWFYKHLAGISAVEEGFKRFSIAPKVPTEMRFAKASMETVRGRVVSGWEKTVKGLEMEIEIPFGSEVELIIPKGYTSLYEKDTCIFINDKFTAVPGVETAAFENGVLKLVLGSGKYSFIAR